VKKEHNSFRVAKDILPKRWSSCLTLRNEIAKNFYSYTHLCYALIIWYLPSQQPYSCEQDFVSSCRFCQKKVRFCVRVVRTEAKYIPDHVTEFSANYV